MSEIIIRRGLLDEAGNIAKQLPGRTAAIITDSNVSPLYAERLENSPPNTSFPQARPAKM